MFTAAACADAFRCTVLVCLSSPRHCGSRQLDQPVVVDTCDDSSTRNALCSTSVRSMFAWSETIGQYAEKSNLFVPEFHYLRVASDSIVSGWEHQLVRVLLVSRWQYASFLSTTDNESMGGHSLRLEHVILSYSCPLSRFGSEDYRWTILCSRCCSHHGLHA